MGDGANRIFQQAGDVELVDDVGGRVAGGGVADQDRVNRKQHDERRIELPGALEHPRRADDGAALEHDRRVGERRAITDDENEYVGGAAQAKMARRDPAHHVVRDVVQENEPVRETKEEIEPRIARMAGEGGSGIHGSNFV